MFFIRPFLYLSSVMKAIRKVMELATVRVIRSVRYEAYIWFITAIKAIFIRLEDKSIRITQLLHSYFIFRHPTRNIFIYETALRLFCYKLVCILTTSFRYIKSESCIVSWSALWDCGNNIGPVGWTVITRPPVITCSLHGLTARRYLRYLIGTLLCNYQLLREFQLTKTNHEKLCYIV